MNKQHGFYIQILFAPQLINSYSVETYHQIKLKEFPENYFQKNQTFIWRTEKDDALNDYIKGAKFPEMFIIGKHYVTCVQQADDICKELLDNFKCDWSECKSKQEKEALIEKFKKLKYRVKFKPQIRTL